MIILSKEVLDLFSETPLYQFIAERAMEEGIQKERQEWLLGSSRVLLTLIQHRYPALEELAAQQIPLAEQPQQLDATMTAVVLLQSPQEVETHLLALGQPADK